MSDKYYIPQDDKVIEDTIEPSGEISRISLPGGHTLEFGVNRATWTQDWREGARSYIGDWAWYQFDNDGKMYLCASKIPTSQLEPKHTYFRNVDFVKLDVNEQEYNLPKLFRFPVDPDLKVCCEIQILAEVKDNNPAVPAIDALSKLTATYKDGSAIDYYYDCVRLNPSYKHPGYTYAFVRFVFSDIPYDSEITVKAAANSFDGSIRWSREIGWRTYEKWW